MKEPAAGFDVASAAGQAGLQAVEVGRGDLAGARAGGAGRRRPGSRRVVGGARRGYARATSSACCGRSDRPDTGADARQGGARAPSGSAEVFAPFTGAFAADAVDLLRIGPGDAVLDVAAGSGSFHDPRRGTQQADVLAVDYRTGHARRAPHAHPAGGRGLRAHGGDGRPGPRPREANRLTAAASMFGVTFFPDAAAGLRELGHVTRPHGRMAVASWSDDGPRLSRLVGEAVRTAVPGIALPTFRTRAGTARHPSRIYTSTLIDQGWRDVEVHIVSHDLVVARPAGVLPIAVRSGRRRCATDHGGCSMPTGIGPGRRCVRRHRRRLGTERRPGAILRARLDRSPGMKVHLVDGTYELFRHLFAVPGHLDPTGIEVGAARGVVGSVLDDARGGRDPRRRRHRPRDRVVPQRPLAGLQDRRGHGPRAARAVPAARGGARALGVTVWPMVEHEADDALAPRPRGRRGRPTRRAGAHLHARQGPRPVRRRQRVVQLDRRRSEVHRRRRRRARSSASPPESIPDYLGAGRRHRRRLPRPARAGARSRPRPCSPATGTSRTSPTLPTDWDVDVRGAAKLAATLAAERDRRRPVQGARDAAHRRAVGAVDDWRWTGPDAGVRGVGRAPRRARDARTGPSVWRRRRA